MPTTPNKGYSVQTTGTNSGTWGQDLNDNVMGIMDNNMGGVVAKSLSSSNVTLNSTESQMAIVRLTGTILANLQITTSCTGFFFVENLTTGNFTITVTNGVAGVVVPQGRATLIADLTNGVRIASDSGFSSGTTLIFQQTSAPSGWTKITANNDAALRIVSGSASTGGSVGFVTAFTSKAVTGTVGNTTLTIDQIPSHDHAMPFIYKGIVGGGNESNSPTRYMQGGYSESRVTLDTGGGNLTLTPSPAMRSILLSNTSTALQRVKTDA